jgi:sugar/nucleoside kinase (ribokinase family)
VVIVFGSINLDLVARVGTIPRPGETLLGTSFVTVPGGKGANQALAARDAGAQVAMFGAVGRDAFADAALANLVRRGVDMSGIARVAARPALLSSTSMRAARMRSRSFPAPTRVRVHRRSGMRRLRTAIPC